MKNLPQKILEIIENQMRNVEKGPTRNWTNPPIKQKGKPWLAEKAARNVILLYSYILKKYKKQNASITDLYREQHLNTDYIKKTIPHEEQQAYEYSPNNPTHERRIAKLLS